MFYVKDCLVFILTVDEAITLVQEPCNLLELDKGFKLTKWISNSREVLESIPKSEWSKEAANLDIAQDELPTERALGFCRNVEDKLGFKVKVKKKTVTRCGILSIVTFAYDPSRLGVRVMQPVKVLVVKGCVITSCNCIA